MQAGLQEKHQGDDFIHLSRPLSELLARCQLIHVERPGR